MIARKHFLAIAVAAMIAGCGGGTDSSQSTAATPQAATSALRAPAGAMATVSPESAANQLMDFAERRFPQFFPEHQVTLTNEPPFLYRHYSNGANLGVVVAQNPFFALNGVYTLGGPLGGLTYQGQLDAFITPTDTSSGGTGNGNGCYDLALADTQGTHIVETFQYSGAITGSQTIDSLVGPTALFEGHTARETAIHTTGTNTAQGTTVNIDTTGTSYASRTGDAEMTQFGSVISATFADLAATTRIVFSPPTVEHQYSLAIGASVTTAQIGSANFQVPAIALNQTSPINSSTTTKYVGQEQITVPAGTYNTCKLEQTTTPSTDVTTSWVIVGKGIPVQTSTSGAQAVTIKATFISLNGQTL